ncbi:hypothetical protein NP493_1050g01005 [Ridgeia piscesae]|uniref:SUEL-type lectin domain-containing protein n=1 Tax=Ridgeia piscesae TaxID=27915 RepID=A0AAD9NIU2_RIDPI|nr:hypothetical protein NP493_1050g01005 [Ridgeia piscesae]
MQPSHCLNPQYGHMSMGCKADVRSYIDQWCSGRSRCEVQVSKLLHHGPKPCPMDFRSYLQVSYECVPVVQSASSPCARHEPVLVAARSGFLSSLVSLQTGCGSIDSPWLVRARPGQKINITLWDFAIMTHRSPRPAASSPVCLVYAIIKESASSVPTQTICGGKSRQSHAYRSLGNSVEVRLVVNRKKQDSALHFLMYYEVIGCPDPALSSGHWFERDDHKAVAGCENSDATWHLTCNGNTWIGTIGNCSFAAAGGSTVLGLFKFSNISQGMSIIIIVCVAVFVGLSVLLVGIIYLKRHFERHPPHSPRDQDYAIDSLEGASYQPVGKPRDAGVDGGSNNYYRTWQLQQQQQQQQLLPHDSQPSTLAVHDGNSSATSGNYKQPSITCSEHVYESPTFERHADGPICGLRDDDSSMRTKYFVLDPDTVICRTGDDRTLGTRFVPAV